MSVSIISKMSQSVSYTFYENVEEETSSVGGKIKLGRIPAVKKSITVRGGAGLPSSRSGFGEMTEDLEGKPLWTADGIVTTVSDADYELLKTLPIFMKHVGKGLLRVLHKDVSGNHKLVSKEAQTMTEDPHSLMTSEKLQQRIKVTVGKLHADDDYRL